MSRINQITGSFVGFIIAALPMLAAGQVARPGPVPRRPGFVGRGNARRHHQDHQ